MSVSPLLYQLACRSDEDETGQPVPHAMGYEDGTWPAVELDHAASVTYMDYRIGLLLSALNDTGTASHTVVFFASDNGAHNE